MLEATEWLMPDHIVVARFTGAITVEDVQEAATQLYELMLPVATERVHLFIDFTNANLFTPNLMDFGKLTFERTENAGWTLIIGGNAPMRFIANFLGKRAGNGFVEATISFQDSYESAIDYLAHRVVAPSATEMRHWAAEKGLWQPQ